MGQNFKMDTNKYDYFSLSNTNLKLYLVSLEIFKEKSGISTQY